MKKKGYTLIELLGVLVILALIILLVWSRASKSLNDTKKTLASENLKLIYSATESYIQDNITEYPRYEGNSYCVTLETLVNEGLLPETLKNFITEEKISLTRTVGVKVNSKRGYEFDFDEKSNVCNLQVNLEAKTVSGATVRDGDIVGESVIIKLSTNSDRGTVKYCISKTGRCNPTDVYSGPIQIDDAGNYTMVYQYIDSEGNASETQEFSFNVDKTVPTINFVLNELTPSGKSEYPVGIWTKNDVEIDISGSTVENGTITEYEIIIVEGVGKGKYKGKNLTLDTTGEYEVKARVKSNSGVVNETPTAYKIKVDKDKPVVTVSGNPTDWTEKDVTLSIDATDVGIGLDSNPYSYDGGDTWVSESSKVFAENAVIEIAVRDAVGNIYKHEDITIDKIDKEPPTIISMIKSSIVHTSDDIIVTGRAIDEKSGIISYQFSTESNLTKDSSGWVNTDETLSELVTTYQVSENGSYYFYVKDAVGNVNKQEVIVTEIDKLPPVIESLTQDITELTDENIVLTGKANDNSGFIAYAFTTNNNLSVDSSEWTELEGYPNTITETHTVTENGTYYFYVKDGANNVVKKQIVIDNIDKTLPTIISLEQTEGFTSETVRLTGKAIDAETGLVGYQFSLNNEIGKNSDGWITISNTKTEITNTFDATANGTYYYYVKDDAGNVISRSIEVNSIDKEPPTISSLDKDIEVFTQNDIVLTGIGIDEHSGLGAYQFSTSDSLTKDSSGWNTISPTTTSEVSFTYTVTENGTYYFYLKDTVGNVAKKAVVVENIDKTKPIINIVPTSSTRDTNVSLKVYIYDQASGLENNNFEYYISSSSNSFEDGKWVSDELDEYEHMSGDAEGESTNNLVKLTVGRELTGDFYFYVKEIKDIVGNASDKNIVTIDGVNYHRFGPYNFDNEGPACTISANKTTWTKEDITLTVSSSDAHLHATPYSWIGRDEGFGVTATSTVSENSTYTAYAKDDLGNVGNCTYTVDKIDKHAPTIISVEIGTSGYTNSSITVVGTSMDELSGINGYQFSTSDGLTENSEGWVSIEATNDQDEHLFTVTENGTYYYYVKDQAGNISKQSFTIDNIDVEKPTLSVNPEHGERSRNVSVTVSASDVGDSGLSTNNAYEYYVSSSDEALVGGTFGAYTLDTPFTIGQGLSGTYYLYIREIQDNAGNTADKNNITIDGEVYHQFGPYVFDNTLPNCTISKSPAGWTNNTVTLTVSSTDTLDANPFSWTNDSEGFGTGTTKVVSDNGTYTAYVKNDLGTVGSCSFTVDSVDKTGPTLNFETIDSDVSKTTMGNVAISDDESGIAETNTYEYYVSKSATALEEGTWKTYTPGNNFEIGEGLTGNYYVYIRRVEDSVGNVSSINDVTISDVTYHKFGPFKFDNTAPVCELTVSGNLKEGSVSTYKETATITITTSDVGSEVSKYGLSKESEPDYNNRNTLIIEGKTPNATYYGFVEDTAGNTNTCSTSFSVRGPESIMESGSDFQTHIASQKSTITEIQFVDDNDVPDGVTGIDVSSEHNGSVMAWIIDNKLYIGGEETIILNADASHLFEGFTNVTTISGFSLLDTSRTTNMESMFKDCTKVNDLEISDFDTKNVTNMSNMFKGCSTVTTIPTTSFDTSKVTNMSSMFEGVTNATSLAVGNFDTKNVTNMANMFLNCSNTELIDVSTFNTSNVVNMSNMFAGCSKVDSLEVSNFDTSNVTNMANMFKGDAAVLSLNVANFNTTSVIDMSGMFEDCGLLESADVSQWDTKNVTNMSKLFNNCNSLENINVNEFDTSKVTDMSYMFNGCSTITSLDVSNFNTSSVTNMANMFSSTDHIESLDLSNFDIGSVTNTSSMFYNCAGLKDLNIKSFIFTNVSDSDSMFRGMPTKADGAMVYVKNRDAQTFVLNTTNVQADWDRTNVVYGDSYMESGPSFQIRLASYKEDITSIEFVPSNIVPDGVVTSYDVSNERDEGVMAWLIDDGTGKYKLYIGARNKVIANEDASHLFEGFKNVTEFKAMEYFDTSRVVNMDSMFKDCESATDLDVSGFTTEEVTNMHAMFMNCKSVTELDVAGFDTANVTDMSYMFAGCSSVTELDVSGFSTTNVTNMSHMFDGCRTITELNVSGFDTANVTDMSYMFNNCANVETLTIKSEIAPSEPEEGEEEGEEEEVTQFFNTSNVTNMESMFRNCGSLTELDVTNFDTSKVTNMSYMFSGVEKVTTLDLMNFDTKNVTDMSYMFAGKNIDDQQVNMALTEIKGLTHFDTSNVTTMFAMFFNCGNLVTLDLSSFDTSNVTNMSNMFNMPNDRSSKLEEIIFGDGWDSSHVTTMRLMFGDCSSLETLDLSSFDTSKVTDMSGMFGFCLGLTELDLSNFDTSKVTNMENMFLDCTNLKLLDISSFDMSSVTNSRFMFDLMPTKADGAMVYVKNRTAQTFVLNTSNVPADWDRTNVVYGKQTMESGPDFQTRIATYKQNITSIEFVADSEIPSGVVASWDVSAEGSEGVNAWLVDVGSGKYKLYIGGDRGIYANENVSTLFSGFTNVTTINNLNLLDTSKTTNMSALFQGCSTLTSLDVSSFDTSKVTDMSSMFQECSSLTSLDLHTFDTSNVTTMNLMFQKNEKVTTLNLSSFDTSKVTDMGWMFSRCYRLNSLDLSNFDTSNVTTMQAMFYMIGSQNNQFTLDVSNLKTGKVTNMRSMFNQAASTSTLFTLDVSKWDVSNVEDMYCLFMRAGENSPVFSLDVSDWDTSKVKNMHSLFYTAGRLNPDFTLDLTKWNTTNVTAMDYMFNGCKTLTSLDLSSFNTDKVKNTLKMFYGCTALKDLDLSSANFTAVTNSAQMFEDMPSKVDGTIVTVKDADAQTFVLANSNRPTDWSTCNVVYEGSTTCLPVMQSGPDFQTTISSYKTNITEVTFQNTTTAPSDVVATYDISATENDKQVMAYVVNDPDNAGKYKLIIAGNGTVIANENASTLFSGFTNVTAINNLNILDTSKVTIMESMFTGCSGLTELDVTNFDTSNVTDMSGMFGYCSGLTGLDVSNFDTSNVTNISHMFAYCSGLTSLDVSNFDTSNVTNMMGMFKNCSGLTSLDVSNFDTSNVTNMYYMFAYCAGLTSLDVSHFDTSNVTNMIGMFYYCAGLTTLDVSNFDTSNVTNMDEMFYYCAGLTSLDVSNFDTSNVTSMSGMFTGCSGLTGLDVSNFDTSNVTTMSYMFNGCTNLESLDISSFDMSSVTSSTDMFSGMPSKADGTIVLVKDADAQTFVLATSHVPNDWDTMNVIYDMEKMQSGPNFQITMSSYKANITEVTFQDSTTEPSSPLAIYDVSVVPNTKQVMAYVVNDTTAGKYKLIIGQNEKVVANEDASTLFKDFTSLKKVNNLNLFDTSKTTNMSYMFYGCTSITDLDVDSIDMSKVTNMENMFNSYHIAYTNSEYTECTDAECAIDELYRKLEQ